MLVYPPQGIPYCPPPSVVQSFLFTHPTTANAGIDWHACAFLWSPLCNTRGSICPSLSCRLYFREPNVHSSFTQCCFLLPSSQEAESPMVFPSTFHHAPILIQLLIWWCPTTNTFFFLSAWRKSVWKMGKTDGCYAEKPWKSATEGLDALTTPKVIKDIARLYT